MIAQSIQNIGLSKGQKVICAVSGGVDSMVLMDALQKEGLNIVVAHVNHHLRPESDSEASWVQNVATQRNLDFELGHIHLNQNQNTQHQAHWDRLKFYQHLTDKHKTSIVFLAHHLNDQLEQFLMKLIRGDQPFSWTGMEGVRSFLNLNLYRPFLHIPKQDLVDYAKIHKVQYLEDASNKDLKYFRNRVRHLLVPKLIEEQPDILTVIPSLLDSFKKAFKIDFNLYKNQNFYYVDEHFYHRQKPIHQYFILQSLMQANQVSYHLSEKQFNMISTRLSKDQTPVNFKMTEGVSLIRQYQMIGAYQERNLDSFHLSIKNPGTYPLKNQHHVIVSLEKIRRPFINQIELCYNENTFPMHIRFPNQGDVMRFDYGHKELKKIFSDHQIPKPLRPYLYVVENAQGIAGILSLSLYPKSQNGSKKIYIYEVLNAA